MRVRVPLANAAMLLFIAPLASGQSATPQDDVAGAADPGLKALYTAEWEWRQKEMVVDPEEEASGAGHDHLPRVDAATQAARLKYSMRTSPTCAADWREASRYRGSQLPAATGRSSRT